MARDTAAAAAVPARRAPLPIRTVLTVIYSLLFVGFTAAYLCFSFIPKPETAALKEFNLTRHEYYNLIIPLVVALAVVWLIGFVGAMIIRRYAWKIKGSRDGQAMGILSNGLLVLALMQPFVSALSSLFGIIDRHHIQMVKPLTMANNYIDLALTGITFIMIAWGARRLYGLVERRAQPLPQTIWVLLAVFASAAYSFFIVIEPIHTPLARRIYFLSDWLLVITIAAPYLFFWYLGVNAAYHTMLYQRAVRGKLYKGGLRYVAAGIAVVVATSVAARIIVSLSTHLTNLKITPLLVIIYALLILEAVGFIFIAAGAAKLRRIEEV